ncbi:MAG TPA: DNA-3-methyladenine glycosylase [Candidatus Acidoferrales bacterium]|nr:DNA-3-methyladenine glycosylase [Bryobacteraceae bacterium]HTS67113.1 DNA-3-methyladenine glycosylase [Candidatus Acidoferrales bacterium]
MQDAIHHLSRNDPVLSQIIERVGKYRIRFREPNFETLVKAIVFQQLSGKVANVIYQRLLAGVGGSMTPLEILRMRPDRMRRLGLSKQKTTYIRDLARHARDRRVEFEALAALPDHEVIERLTQVRGIGVWTVHMFLIFALRRNDVLPTGDLGIRNAIRKAYGLEQLPTPAEMEEMAGKWRPYCSVASWYLWRSLEPDANL